MCLRDQSKDLPVNLSRLADLGLLLKLDIMTSRSLEVKDVKRWPSWHQERTRGDQVDIKEWPSWHQEVTKLTSKEDQVDIQKWPSWHQERALTGSWRLERARLKSGELRASIPGSVDTFVITWKTNWNLSPEGKDPPGALAAEGELREGGKVLEEVMELVVEELLLLHLVKIQGLVQWSVG